VELYLYTPSTSSGCGAQLKKSTGTTLPLRLPLPLIYTTMLHVVLCGCKTWSVTLSEEQRLNVFESRVLSVFGSKGEEVAGSWRRLHNEDS
jgi:hypothetical protein